MNIKPMTLKVLFDADAAQYLFETPFPDEHVITKHKDGRVLLTAKTLDSHQLRWWLRGFGPRVEVVAPKHLREYFRETAWKLWYMYGSSGG